MGVINITPDSFYTDSRVAGLDEVIKVAEQMIEEGVDIIDLGGFSSRPGAEEVSQKEELKRVITPVAELKKRFPNTLISVDTFRSEVARQTLDAGADIINDISGGQADPGIAQAVADFHAAYILMHMKGYVTHMMKDTDYKDMLPEIATYFKQRLESLNNIGVTEVVIDPGFGFSKTLEQNYELLNNLQYFNMIKAPILVGLSRKSMIYKFLNTTPEKALIGTNVLNFVALQKGARILRVHDVREAKETVMLFEKLEG